jgi:hypothetical protein
LLIRWSIRCNVSALLWAKFSAGALAAKPLPTLIVSKANEAARTDPLINRVFMIPPRQEIIAVSGLDVGNGKWLTIVWGNWFESFNR